jgi:glutamine amidotransferase
MDDSRTPIVVVDYGMGNLGSIMNMLKKVGAKAIRSSSASDVDRAGKLILPGVGAFDAGMKNLSELGLVPVLNRRVIEGRTPILGICLGMQLLARGSEEGQLPGLGWVDADVLKFRFDGIHDKGLKIPHMGWNTVEVGAESRLFGDMGPDPRFYFVHSYHVRCNNEENVLARTFYGYEFVSAVMRDNILGVQFHPEKSHKFGMRLLGNFVRLA